LPAQTIMKPTGREHGVPDVLTGTVLALCLAVVSLVFLASSGVRAEDQEPPATRSLPGGGGATLHGRLIKVPNQVPPGRLLVLGFAGDLGFSGKDQPLSSAGAVRHGRVIPWESFTSGVKTLLSADVDFANLETVITDQPHLAEINKAFNFAAAPEGLQEVVKAGIDVLTAANNHAADYGEPGIADSLLHLEAARAVGLKAHAGLGRGDERYRPSVLDVEGIPVGVAAIGRGINPAGREGYGQPLYASAPDFARVSRSLADTKADIRVLSVHYNEELGLLPAAADKQRFRSSVDRGEATIVFGHHSHVASGVERRGDGVIFYGLGNFLHPGTQNMARYGQCRDFGLYARVYLWIVPGYKPVLRAVEITPLRDMHEITRPFPVAEAAIRVSLVNAMSDALSRDGGEALRFTPTAEGTGLACLPGSADYGDELAARCQAQASPIVQVAAPAGADLASCKPVAQPAVAANPKLTTPKRVTPIAQPAKTPAKPKVEAAKSPDRQPPRKFHLFSRSETGLSKPGRTNK